MTVRGMMIADAKAWLERYRVSETATAIDEPRSLDWCAKRIGALVDELADAKEMVAAGEVHVEQLGKLHEIAQGVMAAQLASIVKLAAELAAAKERIADLAASFGEDYDGLTELEALRSDHAFYLKIKEAVGMSHIGNPAMILNRVKELVKS